MLRPMAYDATLADRMRPYLLPRPGVTERAMFGGIGFLLHGNMCCGIWKDELIVRMAPEDAAKAFKEKHARPMDVTGTPMKGWVMVSPPGIRKDADLYGWIDRAVAFVSGLPKKAAKGARKPARRT
jgi:hypothetical protein